MPYTIKRICRVCGRVFLQRSDDRHGCPRCAPPDLTEAEAAAENDKDDS